MAKVDGKFSVKSSHVFRIIPEFVILSKIFHMKKVSLKILNMT